MANPICPQFGCGNYVRQSTSESTKHFCVQYIEKWKYGYIGRGLFNKKEHVELEEIGGGLIMKCAKCLQSEQRITEE